MRNWHTILLVLFLFASCEKNKYVIPQDKMVDVLVDIHLTEGVISTNINDFIYNETKYPAYEKVYQKHNIDAHRFDSSLVFYSEHLDVYLEIYDSVITRLMKIETDVQIGYYHQPNITKVDTLLQNQFPQDSLMKDSILNEFWTEARAYELPDSSEQGKIDFEFEIDTLIGFLYVLKADVLLYPDDCSEQAVMNMEVELRDSTKRTVLLPLIKDSILRAYRLELLLDSGEIPRLIKGLLVDDDKCLGEKHATIRNVRLYELGFPEKVEQLRFKGFLNTVE